MFTCLVGKSFTDLEIVKIVSTDRHCTSKIESCLLSGLGQAVIQDFVCYSLLYSNMWNPYPFINFQHEKGSSLLLGEAFRLYCPLMIANTPPPESSQCYLQLFSEWCVEIGKLWFLFLIISLYNTVSNSVHPQPSIQDCRIGSFKTFKNLRVTKGNCFFKLAIEVHIFFFTKYLFTKELQFVFKDFPTQGRIVWFIFFVNDRFQGGTTSKEEEKKKEKKAKQQRRGCWNFWSH